MKLTGEQVEAVEAAAPSRVVDLMEALKASVEATKVKAAPAKRGARGRKAAAAS